MLTTVSPKTCAPPAHTGWTGRRGGRRGRREEGQEGEGAGWGRREVRQEGGGAGGRREKGQGRGVRRRGKREEGQEGGGVGQQHSCTCARRIVFLHQAHARTHSRSPLCKHPSSSNTAVVCFILL